MRKKKILVIMFRVRTSADSERFVDVESRDEETALNIGAFELDTPSEECNIEQLSLGPYYINMED